MAATHLTLEEAATVLGISPDDFKKRLKTDPLFKTLDRGKIRDGTSFRFKEPAVAELARELGAGSDPGKNLPTLPSPSTPTRGTPKMKVEEPLKLGGDDDDDVFSLSNDDSKSGSSGPKTSKFRRGDLPPAEEIAIDFSGPASGVYKEGGSSSKLSAPRSSTKLTSDVSAKNLGKPKTPKPPTDDSEFELSLDGGDDFELKLNTDTADDEDDALDLGEMPKDVPGGSRVGRGGESGILSRKPNDTGRSLERSKPRDPKSGGSGSKSGGKGKSGSLPPLPTGGDGSEADVDFELTLDAGVGVSSTRLGAGSPSKKKLVTDSDSEFELTLDDPGSGSLDHAALDDSAADAAKGDIFETDFEIPPMDPSGSEAVAIESDTDIEEVSEDSETESEDASTSEVVLLEDDDDGTPRKSRSSATLDDDTEGDVDLADVEVDEDSVSGAMRKRKPEADEDEEEELVPAGAGVYRPVPWGIVPSLFLLPAFVLTLVGGLMGFELLQTMWGYQQPRKPAAPLVRSVASQFDMELRDQ
ncbi:MAG: hypothetical protein C0467_23935 [Planctomycetaceae bacterium]|nr:hypothetical protein [Planctomycetaceae bacterium]